MRLVVLLLIAFLLRGCPPAPGAATASAATHLEAAAIARGLVHDPSSDAMTGLYARDTDRVCIIDGDDARIGVLVDYGQGVSCSGAGRASRSGERLSIDLGGGCTFEAGFDGERLDFPGRLPDSCRALCRGRASLAGLAVGRLSASASEAAALRDPRGRRLCHTD